MLPFLFLFLFQCFPKCLTSSVYFCNLKKHKNYLETIRPISLEETRGRGVSVRVGCGGRAGK